MRLTGGMGQNGTAFYVVSATTGSWERIDLIARATSTSLLVYFRANSATPTFYVDDVTVRLLDDVSITATPASEANSAEGTGLRVDGFDTLTQPVTKLTAKKGRIRFKWTPKHSAADFAKYGHTSEKFMCAFHVSNDNRLYLYTSSANTIALLINSSAIGLQTAGWTCTGLVVAGTTYLVEIIYSPTKVVLKVDGVIRITITVAVNFSVLPTTLLLGSSSGSSNTDSVISPP